MKTKFTQFDLKPYLVTALERINFIDPTPVQTKVIPKIKSGKSIVVQSQTGSGKTHAYLLPLLNLIDPKNETVQVVITAPSRELAYQIYTNAMDLLKESPEEIRVGKYIGGTDKQHQLKQLETHQPQLIIGTPGRILDLTKNNKLQLYTAHHFVVDEADMALDMGFLNDVDKIASQFPEDLQMMVFSATIPQKLKPFLKKYMQKPVEITITNDSVINPDVKNILVPTKGKDEKALVYKLLTMGEPYLALVFANTKEHVEELYNYLVAQGLNVAEIHGGLQPRKRKQIMKAIHNLDYQFVVATDLAARGIDIEGVSMVINTEIPKDLEFFVHRVGRTGRNGMPGTAITLYGPDDDYAVSQLEKMGIHFEPMTYKDGSLVPDKDRNQRQKRRVRQQALNPTLRGLVKKEKIKRKPGYKKKIRSAIQKNERQEKKIERREALRAERKRH